MKIETRKTLILTKAEQKVIKDIYKILDEDVNLNVVGVWDILSDIVIGYDDTAQDYGYNIKIIDN